MSFEHKQLKPVSFRNGLRFSAPGEPSQTVDEDKAVNAAALLGADYPNLRPKMQVAIGDTVEEGQTLFVDRKDDAVCFASPMTGRVFAVDFGPRRTLSAIVVRAEDGLEHSPNTTRGTTIDATSRQGIRQTLLAKGLWPAFRARPFGRIPPSDQEPAAIFVTAIDLAPGAVDPDPVIAASEAAFRQGLNILTKLTDGEVFVCQGTASTFRVTDTVAIRPARFGGDDQAGLVSTHIYRLAPARPEAPVWTIGFQDVLAIGTLYQTGRYDASRVIALTGAPVRRPRLVRVPLGADIRGLLDGELEPQKQGDSATRALSGSPVAGRESGYLGRYHTQVSVLAHRRRAGRPTWTQRLPFFGHNTASALVPTMAMDRALPAGVLTIPLMRALSIGDAQAAEKLGALDLVEEDVAPLNHLCTSGADYRVLLRAVHDTLLEDAA